MFYHRTNLKRDKSGGDSVALWAPMSWTVIFGLSFATIVTLVAIPAMVLMIEKLSGRYKKGIR